MRLQQLRWEVSTILLECLDLGVIMALWVGLRIIEDQCLDLLSIWMVSTLHIQLLLFFIRHGSNNVICVPFQLYWSNLSIITLSNIWHLLDEPLSPSISLSPHITASEQMVLIPIIRKKNQKPTSNNLKLL